MKQCIQIGCTADATETVTILVGGRLVNFRFCDGCAGEFREEISLGEHGNAELVISVPDRVGGHS